MVHFKVLSGYYVGTVHEIRVLQSPSNQPRLNPWQLPYFLNLI